MTPFVRKERCLTQRKEKIIQKRKDVSSKNGSPKEKNYYLKSRRENKRM